MIPYRPEPLNRLRARYLRALITTFDLDALDRGEIISPVDRPDNTFDTRDGLRLVITRADTGVGVRLTIAVGIWPARRVDRQLILAREFGPMAVTAEFRAAAERAIMAITGELIVDWEFGGFEGTSGNPWWFRAVDVAEAART